MNADIILTNLGNNSWLIATTTGATVNGVYGHSSAYDDEQTNLIFVYGGFFAANPTNGQPSDRLFAYDPCKRTWYDEYAHFFEKTVSVKLVNAEL